MLNNPSIQKIQRTIHSNWKTVIDALSESKQVRESITKLENKITNRIISILAESEHPPLVSVTTTEKVEF